MVQFFLSPNYKTWRNVLASGLAGFLEGLLRILTLGFVSSSIEMDVLVWLTVRDCQKKIREEKTV
jgi:hypothetical protein